MTAELRQRLIGQDDEPAPEPSQAVSPSDVTIIQEHPSGKEKHGTLVQLLRGVAFATYFFSSVVAIHLTQWLGAALYFVDRDFYYTYMAVTKQSFGILITTITQWWSPTTVRISGDASVAGQIKKLADGRVQFAFPERLVLIANHQIYTDWLYLWWVGYANRPQMHGWLYIILKESLKYIPFMGPGMMFYGFIFMSRKMAVDQPRLAHRLAKLKELHTAPDGKKFLNPMWLLLFPEGTNASDNGRVKSAKWAARLGVRDLAHLLLPRSTGMYFCLNELRGTIEYVYDCTVAYEGIPRGHFGEDYFGLSSTYFKGQPPRSVNLHWRRFRVDSIPLDSAEAFDVWLRDRWTEKDALMEEYISKGRFPATPGDDVVKSKDEAAYVETEVRTRFPLEWVQIFVVLGVFGVLASILAKLWYRMTHMFS